ncbi:PAS domain S-box protein [Thalassobaculum sp.]|uniref:sensor histidine kinase n=1 Tax=Thalassobaculum sp. TaxID=2022740 RepID=UPI0032EBAF81
MPDSAERLRAVIDTAVDGVILIDSEGIVQTFNKACEGLFGYVADEVVGRNVRMLMPEPYHGEHDGYLRRYLATGERKIIGIGREVSARRKDGTVFPIELSVGETEAPEARPGGEHGFVGIIRDISARKQAERELSDSLARLRAVIGTAVDGVILIDSNGIVQSFNAACEGLFGYQADEVVGHNVRMLMPEPYHGEHDGYLQHYLDTGERKIIGIGREVSARRKDGTVFPIELSVGEAQQGADRIFVGIIRDVTARKEAETALIRHTRELERLNRALRLQSVDLERSNDELRLFASAASHDLKEPLRKIQTFGDFLVTEHADRLDDEGRHYVGVMVDGAARMARMIDGILAYSRAGLAEIDVSRVDLAELWHAVCSDLEIQVAEADATVSVQPMPAIEADAVRLHQVFQNLLSNALKYRSPSRPLTVSVDAATRPAAGGREEVVMSVVDNGNGFDPAYADAIFEPFKRLQGRKGVDGIGLGLALCHRIVRLHSGAIEAEGRPGIGATFRVTLPVRQEARNGDA